MQSGVQENSDHDVRPCPGCGSREGRLRYQEMHFLILRCRECKLTYLANPPPEEGLYEQYYDSSDLLGEAYTRNSVDARLRELYQINEQRVKHIQHFKEGGFLLDVGCGRGFFLKSAADAGFCVRGIDISGAAVAYARSTFGLSVNGDAIETLVAAGDRFDVITLWHVLEHFADPFAVLRQIRELLAEDGVCVIEVPNERSLKFRWARVKWEGGNHPRYHRTFFTSQTLGRALRASGFERVNRLQIVYRLGGRSRAYEIAKKTLNIFAMDAFLDYAAFRNPLR